MDQLKQFLSWRMFVFALAQGMSLALTAQDLECNELPLAFRENISAPDDWEILWEATWPDASSALATWRSDQFLELQLMWKELGGHLTKLKQEASNSGLPESAAYLAWWSTFENPFHPKSCDVPYVPWRDLKEKKPLEAVSWAHAKSGTALPIEEWAIAMRTGMRLMENLDMPPLHMVKEGETVFSIARLWGVSPQCIAMKNDVWDDIQPGMTLLIPHTAH